MSRTLTLSDAAWASARNLAATGRRADALAILTPLLARPGLAADFAATAHRLAAELHLHADRYRAARRHLAAAVELEPGHAETHYQLGVAFEDDPYGCDDRAARQFLRAVKLDPGNPVYLAALGRAAVRANKDRLAKKAIRKAVRLAPTDPVVLTIVVDALREAGRVRRAWKMVCRARFLAPANADIQKLWERVKFDLACCRQKSPHHVGTGSRVLPFVCLVGRSGESRIVRRDLGSNPAPYIGRLRVRG